MCASQFTSRLRELSSLRYNCCKHAEIAASTELSRPRRHILETSPAHQTAEPVLQQLHWLPIQYRIDYKVATLAYKIRSTGSPAYLLPTVSDYTPTRDLRSSSQSLLITPAVRTETAKRAFSHAAPPIWNRLPADIRSSDTYGQFRTAIHTHYYRLAFTH